MSIKLKFFLSIFLDKVYWIWSLVLKICMEYEFGNIIDVLVFCLYLVLSVLVSGVDLFLSNYMYMVFFD